MDPKLTLGQAPIIVLFGEQLTQQFLSESINLLDNIIFALAPIGILTAVVSAIRVCGNSSLKAFIGRAQEGPADAEIQLLPCVSETTAELFNNAGISRIFGRPTILEVVTWEVKDPLTKEPVLEIGTLDDAVLGGHWALNGSKAIDAEKDDQLDAGTPNLSLNKGIKRKSRFWFYLAASLGTCLQIGMLSNMSQKLSLFFFFFGKFSC